MWRALSPHAWWWSVAVCAALIAALSVIPTGRALAIGHLDKAVHLVEYLVLAWLLVQALRPADPAAATPIAWTLLWAAGLATAYGVLMELVQALIPWRSADVVDAIVNALGAAVGVWIAHRIS